MTIRRFDTPDTWRKQTQCFDREHEVPGMIALPPGRYVHECPACGRKVFFVVDGPTFGGKNWYVPPTKTSDARRNFMVYDLEWYPKTRNGALL